MYPSTSKGILTLLASASSWLTVTICPSRPSTCPASSLCKLFVDPTEQTKQRFSNCFKVWILEDFLSHKLRVGEFFNLLCCKHEDEPLNIDAKRFLVKLSAWLWLPAQPKILLKWFLEVPRTIELQILRQYIAWVCQHQLWNAQIFTKHSSCFLVRHFLLVLSTPVPSEITWNPVLTRSICFVFVGRHLVCQLCVLLKMKQSGL